ncbi:mechanosensitive ion channel family protein [Methanococcoides methylutens]|uniref:Mechanosensitive ion channel family protein n=1 Tax=Methanococcoides methylutens MM1 TaxID=1434104 RepID=A0A0E3X0D8_METMT|nr:mechanosensitive ion channel domain-containing protein [Methanococcoides methylutens]AKB85510.1 Mechanosensitive ion channel family protein [Methanococcoides methylutens MM1]
MNIIVLEDYYFSIIVVAGTLILLALLSFVFRKTRIFSEQKTFEQFILLLVSFIGLVVLVLSLPISDNTKQTLLSFFGILIGATIALSSTTFVANGMSGIMLSRIKPFKAGDFIRVEDTFGRVSDIGILHTQVQSIDRDLITIPNLKLISNPLVTISSSGTVISTTVSLGYNVSREKVEKSLIKAAEKVELENIFVHLVELGDFSVTYKVGGLLKDVSSLITKRSDLKKMMFDSLHEDHIEIVSPTFMNQRIYPEDAVFIPVDHDKVTVKPPATYEYVTEVTTEDVIFGKAIEAEITKKISKMIEDMEQKQNDFVDLVNRIADENLRATEKKALDSLLGQKEDLKQDLVSVTSALEDEENTSTDGVRLKSLQYLDSRAGDINIGLKELLDRVSNEIEQ